MRILFTIFLVLFISSCDSAYVWEEGRYKVNWIDVYENRSLGYYLDDGFKVPRIGREVIAIGSNKEHIVVMQFDKTTGSIKYYYIIKALDAVETDLSPGIKGPYSLEEFSIIKVKNKLPEFSVEFK
ncbi:hypothetical protein B0W48_13715 [Pseudoalteromonas aliena]|uniref:DUF3997 domain-containing protein n=1 Tax=Pseudoalteromonas aliena TaxID=247523 RepID=A0A1Q2H089_9GAMM|nr:hypothetical protein [Pseudoalteromonas aliena]AQQ00772.1 hypothetical protein B0W48_13715 [Pseudoalteromonas aliena]